MSKIKETDFENRTYCFFNNIKNFGPNRIEIDKRSYKNFILYYVGCITNKNLRCVKINSKSPLYIIIDKADGYVEESNRNKNLKLVPIDKNKETL